MESSCAAISGSPLLGQNERRDNVSKQFAVLTSARDEENFESFLARYDESGNLEWAQTSGMTGNDFYLDLASLGINFTLFLGNRNIGVVLVCTYPKFV